MRKIIAITQVTLDGVMQSPGGPEEDPRNGFTHGGWAMSFLDDALNQAIGETIAGSSTCFWDAGPTRSSPPTGRTRATTRLRRRSTCDEIRRHAQPRPTRLGELAARRR
jgi:acyl-coenzyme A thioesterase PaaI-like protein